MCLHCAPKQYNIRASWTPELSISCVRARSYSYARADTPTPFAVLVTNFKHLRCDAIVYYYQAFISENIYRCTTSIFSKHLKFIINCTYTLSYTGICLYICFVYVRVWLCLYNLTARHIITTLYAAIFIKTSRFYSKTTKRPP